MESKKTKMPRFQSDREEHDFWNRHSVEGFTEELEDLDVVIQPAPERQGGAHKTASSLLYALPSLSLTEETLKQVKAQVKDRRKHSARVPRL